MMQTIIIIIIIICWQQLGAKKVIIWSYSSVVEHSTADREVLGSTPSGSSFTLLRNLHH